GENIRMSISPNPADDYAEIRLEGLHGNATVCLSDMQGRLVYKQQVADAAQTLRINTQMLSSGLYIIKVQTQAGYGIAKIAIR
ncbi:MAG: T9SS type A sorting domain-containing protein, partial [Bacteroidales bacterium]|nr:T9SS type A sorting domain-containing protein [Bacteroidales bacterium]